MRKPPKLDRKALKKPDEFVVRGRRMLDRIADHRSILFGCLGIIALVAIGMYAFDVWSASHSEKAWRGYFDATRAPEDKRWDELKKFYEKFYSSRPRMFAAVALADHYFQEAKKEALKDGGDPTKNAAEAVDWYTKALTFKDLLPTEKQLLTLDRGNTQEVAKKYDEAAADFKSASDMEGQGKALGLIALGRIHEIKKENDKAVQVYTQVSSQFADTEYGKVAKNYLRRLKSPLFKDDPNNL